MVTRPRPPPAEPLPAHTKRTAGGRRARPPVGPPAPGWSARAPARAAGSNIRIGLVALAAGAARARPAGGRHSMGPPALSRPGTGSGLGDPDTRLAAAARLPQAGVGPARRTGGGGHPWPKPLWPAGEAGALLTEFLVTVTRMPPFPRPSAISGESFYFGPTQRD